MPRFTRQDDPSFTQFKVWVRQQEQANPDLIRLDCLNPVKAIKHEFDFSTPSTIDPVAAWKQYLNVNFDHCFTSLGVRDSLYKLFLKAKSRDLTVAIPTGVYPVYQQIANAVGIKYNTYHSIPECKFHAEDILLIAAPHVPSGKDLSIEYVAMLMQWLRDPNHTLIIDRVYDYDNSKIVQPLINTNQTIVCYSLSKTFLSPLLMGLTIVPES